MFSLEAEPRDGEDLEDDVLILQGQEVASFPVACGISFAQRSEWYHPDDPTLRLARTAMTSQLTPAQGSGV